MAHKAKNIYCLTFYRESLPTLPLARQKFSASWTLRSSENLNPDQ